ncbi:MAG: CRISPR-associated protein Cas4 [Propionicimonas sp.]|uniref:CRISPR-associated protein Cas4 n=1 Tax=Propionicimonas sp. TaxID=1955623 RepID=UPI003D0AFD3F
MSSLQHYAYCPSQASLIRDGVWLDNHLTVSGDLAHERVDQLGTDRRRGKRAHHRVSLVSHRLGIHGIADTIEEDDFGQLSPVEHKWGRGAKDLFPTIAQVVAQALCLEEMTGRHVRECAVFVVQERIREPVDVDAHRDAVENLIVAARKDLAGVPPRPVYVARRCRSCSVLNACQPKGAIWM